MDFLPKQHCPANFYRKNDSYHFLQIYLKQCAMANTDYDYMIKFLALGTHYFSLVLHICTRNEKRAPVEEE
jgi:hypothetical protein